ncbi:3-methyl-2-oxobutanoate hydroxymethyltransferase [Thiomicrospira microaerophila]|uniref:3-methyl-2-oxobutanoate hydroxymethyltransferase n=1 Tax=Thiomicrospira microaerophila TaxID=406020 RepID=UPI00200F4826|nr:3-methyl-2-oxobutanoate hydroxymethyltransferase [Thiomicrospira microaerophila]UQB41751.1 3-methyl-2-oxobutanoate hydroxymethyltransferase [Thiomicrospira microaerophila]
MKRNLAYLQKCKSAQQPIVCMTAYDAAFAHWANQADVDVLLVGDSLGMVVQGHANTLPVTLEQMIYHAQAVQRTNNQAWCIVDLPFMADSQLSQTLENSARLIKEASADMVKLEGGQRVIPAVRALSDLGVPVCGHLGLLPQSVLKKGYRVQGRDEEAAEQLLADAQALEQAGADMLVLECVPSRLAERISQRLTIPVIGIGAGSNTDGQVLVVYDLLGLTPGKLPRFSKNFLTDAGSISQAMMDFTQAVRSRAFPAAEHEMAD